MRSTNRLGDGIPALSWVSREWMEEVEGQVRGSKIWWICKTAWAKWQFVGNLWRQHRIGLAY